MLQDSESKPRDVGRNRWQFPTRQFPLRPANLFHTQPRCDANRVTALPQRALANWENKRELAWPQCAPSDRRNRHPRQASRHEKTSCARLGADGGYGDRWVRIEAKPIPFYFPKI